MWLANSDDGQARATLDRRHFLLGGAALAATFIIPDWAEAAIKKPIKRTLGLHNIHNGERHNITYFDDGHYVKPALKALNYALRDWRSHQSRRMDPRLYDTLWLLQHHIGSEHAYDVICGYRTAKTNAMLRSHSDGVAQNSYHIRGMAVDISLPNVPLKRLHQAALSLKAGGVGYYPDSDFVHVDVGPRRTW
jgi:uncharacterized protein YcbK (DUF882 family)